MHRAPHLIVSVSALLALGIGLAAAKFPSNIKRCQYGDHKCMEDTVMHILKNYNQGYGPLNLAKISPLETKAISIKQGKMSPVNIDLKFRNCQLHGLADSNTVQIKGFGEDLAGPHEFHMKGPGVKLLCDYTISGKVLILPISGTGKSNITLADANLGLKFHGEPLYKNGLNYLKLKNLNMSLETSRMYTNFTNLFNGDKNLGDNMNAFLNENWQDIFGELKPSITSAFGSIFEAVINNVFTKYPYEDFFEKLN